MKYVFISFIFYATQLINVFVAIQYYHQGSTAYLVLYLISVALDKLFMIFYAINVSKNNEFIKIWLLDFFFLGFFNFTPQRFRENNLSLVSTLKLIYCLYPMIILQTFITFDISDHQISLTSVLFYFNYILQIFLVSLSYYEYLKKKNQIWHSFLTHLSYYVSLRCILSSFDQFGINLGYYCLIYIFYNVIIQLKELPRDHEYMVTNVGMFVVGQVMNFYLFMYASRTTVERDYIFVHLSQYLSYFNQLFRLLLNKVKLYELSNIYQLNLLFGILSSISFLLVYSIKIWKLTFYQKLILIHKKDDYIKATEYLSTDHNSITLINVQVFSRDNLVCENFKKEKMPFLDKDNTCIYYNFQKSISYQLKLKQNIIVNNFGYSVRCNCKIKQLYSEEEFVHDNNIGLLPSIEISEVLLQRYQNGLLFTKQTAQLIKILPQKEKNIILNLRQSILQCITAMKLVYPEMVMLPQQITYDLYSQS